MKLMCHKNSIFALMKKRIFINLLFLIFTLQLWGQTATIVGKVVDDQGQPISFVAVYDKDAPQHFSQTDNDGMYKLTVKSLNPCVLVFSLTGYKKTVDTLHLQVGEVIRVDKKLEINAREIKEVIVQSQEKESNFTRIDPKIVQNIPSVGLSGVETGIKTQPGVTSRNEFSSQYNVRGGSFDENLVYVDDIQIYRPILVRSGQQEGLSFINPDLVQNISFSSGGFEAEYGDKMSSVLDIVYKKPTTFHASATLSLIGVTAHFENVSKNKKLTYILGVRYKNNAMIVKNLDEKGDYHPRFFDIQTKETYQLTPKSQLGFIGYASLNKYLFVPQSKETIYGSQTKQYSIYVDFQGNEKDVYNSIMGALWNVWTFNQNTSLKAIVSSFKSNEHEAYDIIGRYNLSEMSSNSSIQAQTDSTVSLAAGSFFNHARNDLNSQITSFSLSGKHAVGISTLSAGVDCNVQSINEDINSWTYIDSAEYNMPYSDTSITIQHAMSNAIRYNSVEIGGFFQNVWRFQLGDDLLSLSAGIRSAYKTSNEQFITSPRIKLSYKPHWERVTMFRAAFGYYFQPPFLKEMVATNGQFYSHLKAQEAIHYMLGADYYLKIWERPFKLTVESYYKDLRRITPYIIENVKTQYLPEKTGKAYVAGIDMKLNGEFIKGTDSWVSLSLMKTEEKIEGSSAGWTRRPTDQRVNLGVYFQDYLPWDSTYKMSLTMFYGTKVPGNLPNETMSVEKVKMLPAYQRVDIGFSKQIIAETDEIITDKKGLKSLWVGVEILNLLDLYNTVSYFWVQDVQGYYYPTPNYLTGRIFNLKVTAKL